MALLLSICYRHTCIFQSQTPKRTRNMIEIMLSKIHPMRPQHTRIILLHIQTLPLTISITSSYSSAILSANLLPCPCTNHKDKRKIPSQTCPSPSGDKIYTSKYNTTLTHTIHTHSLTQYRHRPRLLDCRNLLKQGFYMSTGLLPRIFACRGRRGGWIERIRRRRWSRWRRGGG
jgi:hypothetical protein